MMPSPGLEPSTSSCRFGIATTNYHITASSVRIWSNPRMTIQTDIDCLCWNQGTPTTAELFNEQSFSKL